VLLSLSFSAETLKLDNKAKKNSKKKLKY